MIDDLQVKKILKKIYRDALMKRSSNNFISLKYFYEDMSSTIPRDDLDIILGFLPNTQYRNSPFVVSVYKNIKTGEYEIIVKNPSFK